MTLESGTRFHFNSGLNGDVIISRSGRELTIPGDDLKTLFADQLSGALTHWAEEIDLEEVLFAYCRK